MSNKHGFTNSIEGAPAVPEGEARGGVSRPSAECGALVAGAKTAQVLTSRQLEILQHSLGVDKYGEGRRYRNHFCAGADDEPTCRELVAMGYMQQHRTTEVFPYFNCSVTEEGRRAMAAESPKPPKLTRSQVRYREFLRADSGVSFMEWLKYSRGVR